MRNVLDESLRLYPPVPRDQRDAVKDDTLPSGFHIHMSNSLQRHNLAYFSRSRNFVDVLFLFIVFAKQILASFMCF